MKIKDRATAEKLWTVRKPAPDGAVAEIASALGVSPITASLLYMRGCTNVEKASGFISPEHFEFHDPFALDSMTELCEALEAALAAGRRIVVYGDYDVDGVTSTCLLCLYLRSLGADVGYYIPTRTGEGYGLNNAAIDRLKAGGAEFMITVDTGITAIDEIAYAKSVGLETVVTDHHECRRTLEGEIILPDTCCVDPKRSDSYPFDALAGVGVAYKTVCALEMRRCGMSVNEVAYAVLEKYSELVAIGTVADVMPLIDENRALTAYGLRSMEEPKFIGVKALISAASGTDYSDGKKKKFGAGLISYTLAPRINAAGRLANAAYAAELFLTEDESTAAEIADGLCKLNAERQKRENEMLEGIDEKIASECSEDDPVIVVSDDSWNHGIIGIVASRITDRTGMPCILVSFEGGIAGDGGPDDIGKGSGRSVKGFDLSRALEYASGALLRYGGHELAAGLTVKRSELQNFRRLINECAAETMSGGEAVCSYEADAVIEADEITRGLVEELSLLEPCGQANPTPQFEIRDLLITEVRPLKEGKHIKLTLSYKDKPITALLFGTPYRSFPYICGDSVDLLAKLELNEYNGRKSIQLNVRDIKLSRSACDAERGRAHEYECLCTQGAFPADEFPERADFAAVYRALKARLDAGDSAVCLRKLMRELNECGVRMTYIKLRAALDILSEAEVISAAPVNEQGVYSLAPGAAVGKAKLEKVPLYGRLRSGLA